MTAELRLKGESKRFIADRVGIDGGWVHAEGRWRTYVGPVTGVVLSDLRAYTWPRDKVVQIRREASS